MKKGKKYLSNFKYLFSKVFVFLALILALVILVFATQSIVNYMSSASSGMTPHPWNDAWVYEQRWWIGSDCESGVLVNSKQSGPYSGPITDNRCGDTVWEGNNTKSNVRSFKVADCSEYSSGYCTSGCKYFDSCSKCAPPDKTEAEVCSDEPPPVEPPPIVPGTSCIQGATSCQQNNGVNTGYQCNCVVLSSSQNVWQCNSLNTTACPTGSSGGGTPPAASGCRQFDGNASACRGDCAYYGCSSQCHPRGTSNCDAGCSNQCGNSGGGGQGGGAEDTSSPKGYLDAITANKEVMGWACDQDNYSQPITVHFYIDGGAGAGGTFIGSTIADKSREAGVGSACGGRSASGYVFTIPEEYAIKGPAVQRSIYAYGINIGQGSNKVLTNSGKTFTTTPPQPTVCTAMTGTLKSVDTIAADTTNLDYVYTLSSPSMLRSVDLTINPIYAGNNGWIQYTKLLPPFPTSSAIGNVTFKQLRDKIIAAGQHTNIVQINTQGIMVVANVVQLDGSFCDGGGKWVGGPNNRQSCVNNCVATVKLARPPAPSSSFKVIFDSKTNMATISLYGHRAEDNVVNYRLERCSGENCTNFTHLKTIDNLPSQLLTYSVAVPAGQVHRYRLRSWNGSTYSEYSPVLNSTISWIFTGKPVCDNGTTPTAPTRMTYALWPPNPLKWINTGYISGDHTISVVAADSWNYGYIQLRLSNAALVPTGIPEHSKITYGTPFDWPMAKIDKDLPSGTYTIKYRAPESLCGVTVPPLKVKNFTAELRGNRTVKMNWSNQPNVLAHRIDWCAGADCTDFKSLALLHNHKTTYTTPSIPQGQTHRFRMRTFNGKELGPAFIRSFP